MYLVKPVCPETMDITIIVDVTPKPGTPEEDFTDEKAFVDSVAAALDLPEEKDQPGSSSELTVIPFGENPKVSEFKPEERFSVENLGPEPTLEDALKKYKEEKFPEGEKFNVSKSVILVVDADKPISEETKKLVEDLRKAGDIVTVVPVGDNVDKTPYEELTKDPDRVEVVPTEEDITKPDLVEKLVNESCVHGMLPAYRNEGHLSLTIAFYTKSMISIIHLNLSICFRNTCLRFEVLICNILQFDGKLVNIINIILL